MLALGKQCKLCLKVKPLQKKSHIIPNWFYKSLLIEKDGFIEYKLYVDEFKKRRKNTGEYEPDILCRECDNKILNERYEDYAHAVFLEHNKLPQGTKLNWTTGIDRAGTRCLRIENLDFNRLKLFFLSILWKASISSREFFSWIKLNEEHEERIRKILFENSFCSDKEYPFVVFVGENHMVQPSIKQENGYKIYRFFLPGIILLYYVGDSINYQFQNDFISLKIDGTLYMGYLPENSPFLKERDEYFKKAGVLS